tara:strand:- start:205 stop:831 length:627 start_codon:yes stop_codon:yes gene_type:complete
MSREQQKKKALHGAALNKLAELAGVTSNDYIQSIEETTPQTVEDFGEVDLGGPPRPDQMTTPMQVNLGNPESVANLQRTKDMLTRGSTPLKEVAMRRMPPPPPTRPAARGGQALEGFVGQVPGRGHGMEDNVYMPIVDRGDQVATLAVSPDEYVVDAHTMSALGNGSADAGAEVMDRVVKEVRQEAFGNTQQPNQINGLQSLRNKMIG